MDSHEFRLFMCSMCLLDKDSCLVDHMLGKNRVLIFIAPSARFIIEYLGCRPQGVVLPTTRAN